MSGRLWRGWTALEKAHAYETLPRTKMLPGIHRLTAHGERTCFDAVRKTKLSSPRSRFPGRSTRSGNSRGRTKRPRLYAYKARRMLSRFEVKFRHYETILVPHRAG